jgi:acetylornithine deacetylase/succinyl-diaminopimelate desuccinylase-like protein
MESVRQLLRENDGNLPVNVKFLIEGEEESGGNHIEQYVELNAAALRADAALICDTAMFAPGIPSLTTGLRGIVYGEIEAQGAAFDLHSGDYGGAAPNPLEALAQVIAALKARDGRILIPEIYDAITAPSPAELEAWKGLPFDENVFRESEVGSTELAGEPGYSVLERIWARPSLEVHGFRGGYIGEGAKTVIPAKASVKISMRLVPGQDPGEVRAQLEAAIARACPPAIRAEFRVYSTAPAWSIDPGNSFLATCARAMEAVFSRPTAYIRCGGSIPIVGIFTRVLDLPCVLAGFGLPDDHIHAPNEKLSISNYLEGIKCMVQYFSMLADPSSAAGPSQNHHI